MSDPIFQYTQRLGMPFADETQALTPLRALVKSGRLDPISLALSEAIVKRANPIVRSLVIARSETECRADICIAAFYGASIDLHKFLLLDHVDFEADFRAIIKHLDRHTGKLPAWINLHCLRK